MKLIKYLRDWRIRRAQRRLAGLKAKYAAVRALVELCYEKVPGALVRDMRILPGEIAEVEELLRQLQA
jgi:hypothetical protein